MMNLSRIIPVLMTVLVMIMSFAASSVAQDRLTAFRDHDPESRVSIDYSVWNDFLDGMVYDVGFSDRRPARSSEVVRRTGSRMPLGSTSRYRNEGNRVILHLVEEEYADAISVLREEIEQIPDNFDFSSLNKTEQLVYWLNLHNIIVIDELLKEYPITYVREDFHNTPVTRINGIELSLNDIRLGIVSENWDNPLVMYGFFSGAVGGPSIRETAFNSRTVWRSLSRSAEEYVNALRGVDMSGTTLRVSRLYFEHQALFPAWPEDLIDHLDQHADDDVGDILASFERGPREVPYDEHIADLTNGRACVASTRFVQFQTLDGETSVEEACDPIPVTTEVLLREVRLRRLRLLGEGRVGRVTVRDLYSPDPDARPRQNLDEIFGEDDSEDDENDPENVFGITGQDDDNPQP